MAKYTCKNFGSCSVADSGKEFEVALGGDDRCPECTMTLAPLPGDESSVKSGGMAKLLPIGASVAALVLASAGYTWWRGSQVVVLMPEASSTSVVAPTAASVPPQQPIAAASALSSGALIENNGSEAMPAEVNVGETSARLTCDEAIRAKSLDAAKVCRRASAVTLLNSGAQAAVSGNLEQAERDYLAAKDKDPDIAELYFNLAVLKARQGKGSESVVSLRIAVETILK